MATSNDCCNDKSGCTTASQINCTLYFPSSHALNAVDWSNVRLYCRINKFSTTHTSVGRWHHSRLRAFFGNRHTLHSLTLMIIMLIMDLHIHSLHSRCCCSLRLFFFFVFFFTIYLALLFLCALNTTRRDGCACACLTTLNKINFSLWRPYGLLEILNSYVWILFARMGRENYSNRSSVRCSSICVRATGTPSPSFYVRSTTFCCRRCVPTKIKNVVIAKRVD